MTTQEQINYKQLFSLYCSSGTLRPKLLHPFKQDGYYYATDGYSLLYVPQSEIQVDFITEVEGTPDCKAVIPLERSEPIEISINRLHEFIETKAPKIIEQVDCIDCGGEGGEECNLSHWHDCEYCGGTGTSNSKTGKEIPDPGGMLVFPDVSMKVRLMQKLVNTAVVLKSESVLWIYRKDRRGSLFQIKPFHILLMSCSMDENKWIKLNHSDICRI